MIEQKNSALWFKINGALRYLLGHSGRLFNRYYVVTEYPKSGGSWVGEMLSEALDIPFPRNRLPMLRSCILHGHMMHSWNMDKVVVVWRDGRDVLVSQYYHSLFYNDYGNKRLVDESRADLKFNDNSDIRGNLPAFMEYVYEVKKNPHMSWKEFGDYWLPLTQFQHVKYECFRSDPVITLTKLLCDIQGTEPDLAMVREVVHNHSFEVQSGRKAGEENATSFLRKGVVGDWKNHFSFESRLKFNKYAGQQLIDLGYESDDSWVSSNGSSI